MTDETRLGSPETGPADPDTTGTVDAADEAAAPADTEDGTAGDTAIGDTATGDTATGDTATEHGPADGDAAGDPDADGGGPDGAASTGRRRRWSRRRRTEDGASGDGASGDATVDAQGAGTEAPAGRRRRAVLPLVPVLAVLLVLLLGGTGYLFLTRPGTSSVATADYVDALQAARAGIVDVTSFDYLTLDDDITQIQAVTTGDLTTESVQRLNDSRQSLTDAQAVVNTEVVGAAVTAADDRTATVYMVIQSTQTSSASQQAQVQRYRIEVDLTKDGGRWLLSGIQGR